MLEALCAAFGLNIPMTMISSMQNDNIVAHICVKASFMFAVHLMKWNGKPLFIGYQFMTADQVMMFWYISCLHAVSIGMYSLSLIWHLVSSFDFLDKSRWRITLQMVFGTIQRSMFFYSFEKQLTYPVIFLSCHEFLWSWNSPFFYLSCFAFCAQGSSWT